jgi:rare lipoprotein A (peptidoglycan hydrolase)
MSSITVRKSINDEANTTSASAMWFTRPFHHRMAANGSFFERIALRAAARCKRFASNTDQSHNFAGGRTSRGKSRLTRLTI